MCQLQIPFTGKGHKPFRKYILLIDNLVGSGITLYGVLLTGWTNFTITIDTKTAPYPVPFPRIDEGSPAVYNFTLYDVQSLPMGYHSLALALVGLRDGLGSEIIFDYAYVNETDPSSPPPSHAHAPQ